MGRYGLRESGGGGSPGAVPEVKYLDEVGGFIDPIVDQDWRAVRKTRRQSASRRKSELRSDGQGGALSQQASPTMKTSCLTAWSKPSNGMVCSPQATVSALPFPGARIPSACCMCYARWRRGGGWTSAWST